MAFRNYLLVFSILLLLPSCNEDHSPEKVKIRLEFSHQVNGEALQVNSVKKYTNSAGEQFSIETFKYYISNITLKSTNGLYYVEPESYHLIAPGQSSDATIIELEAPIGEYEEVEFGIGVDPEKNNFLSYEGDLDPNNDMAWKWEQSYKFLVFEGKYFTSSTGSFGAPVVYHIGENKNYKKIALPAILNTGKHKTLIIKVAIEELWKDPNPVTFEELNEAMFGENASRIAENYSGGMFSIESVKK